MADTTTPNAGRCAGNSPSLTGHTRHSIALGNATSARVCVDRIAQRVTLELLTVSPGPTWIVTQVLSPDAARGLARALLALATEADGGAA